MFRTSNILYYKFFNSSFDSSYGCDKPSCSKDSVYTDSAIKKPMLYNAAPLIGVAIGKNRHFLYYAVLEMS